jgi:hypothetical protein
MTKPLPRLRVVQDVPANPLGPLTAAEKLIRAKSWLGARWILHPANKVKRLATPWGERK